MTARANNQISDDDLAATIRAHAVDGLSAAEMARRLGLWVNTVTSIAREYDITLPSHADSCRMAAAKSDVMARRVAAVRESRARNRFSAATSRRAVPAWVPEVLREDYRDRLRMYGAFVAAREIGAMVREMEVDARNE